MQRKAIYTDEAHPEIKVIVPLGVGAVDPGLTPPAQGRTIIMTPELNDAFITKKKAVRHHNGSHYNRKPYIPITRRLGMSTLPVAFHTYQTTMVRGFVSHGCMRMRDNDLFLLHDILSRGGQLRVPVTIKLNLENAADNPFPMMDNRYERMVDCSTIGRHEHELQYPRVRRDDPIERQPHACADPGDRTLTYTRMFEGVPDFASLQTLPGDTMPRDWFSELMYQDNGLLNESEQYFNPNAGDDANYTEDDYRSESV